MFRQWQNRLFSWFGRKTKVDVGTQTQIVEKVDKESQTVGIIRVDTPGYILPGKNGNGGKAVGKEGLAAAIDAAYKTMFLVDENFEKSVPPKYMHLPFTYMDVVAPQNGGLGREQLRNEIARLENLSKEDRAREIMEIGQREKKKLMEEPPKKEREVVEMKQDMVRNPAYKKMYRIHRFRFHERLDNLAFGLNASMVPDAYMAPILLGQTPLPTQYFAQWLCYLQEKTSLVIVIGELVADEKVGRELIDAFWPLKEQTKSVYEDTSANNSDQKKRLFEVKTTARENMYGADIYTLSAVASDEPKDVREITLVHIEKWPLDWKADLTEFCQLLKRLYSDVKVAIHCPTGIEQSASFLVLWLSMQCLAAGKDTVNPIGWWTHICNYRLDIFNPDKQSAEFLADQYLILLRALDKLMTEEGEPQKTTDPRGAVWHNDIPQK